MDKLRIGHVYAASRAGEAIEIGVAERRLQDSRSKNYAAMQMKHGIISKFVGMKSICGLYVCVCVCVRIVAF